MNDKWMELPGCTDECPVKPDGLFERLARQKGSYSNKCPPEDLNEVLPKPECFNGNFEGDIFPNIEEPPEDHNFFSDPSRSFEEDRLLIKLTPENFPKFCFKHRSSKIKSKEDIHLIINEWFRGYLFKHKMRHLDVNEDTEENANYIHFDHSLARMNRQRKKKAFKTYPWILRLAEENLSAFSCTIDRIWFDALEKEFQKPYFKEISAFIDKESIHSDIFPPRAEIYNWTLCYDIHFTRVVILGENPYSRRGEAHGLAFSVNPGCPIPKSLSNIYAELQEDIPGFKIPKHGCLYGWADQGVLLLNICLTVKRGKPKSHEGIGWEKLTDAVLKYINENCSHVVFMLWGKKAREKSKLISQDKHLILKSSHPSHRGFSGCKHFSKANEYLRANGIRGIQWKFLPEH